jgi:molecular chaperone GrpE
VSEQKSLTDKLTHFIFGDPIPVLSENDLQIVRELHQRLDALSKQIAPSANPSPRLSSEQTRAQPTEVSLADNLTAQVRKLAKTQFKANTLQESQFAQQQETLTSLQHAIDQHEKTVGELAKQHEQAVAAAQLDLLKSILPALDSLDAAFGSGRRQVLQLPMSREVRQAVIAWLDGIRLARMRLLDLLAAHDIYPIQTVGQSFDPYYHIAVATDTTGRAPNGIIISEDRPGYASSTKVLREAEVVVSRSG